MPLFAFTRVASQPRQGNSTNCSTCIADHTPGSSTADRPIVLVLLLLPPAVVFSSPVFISACSRSAIVRPSAMSPFHLLALSSIQSLSTADRSAHPLLHSHLSWPRLPQPDVIQINLDRPARTVDAEVTPYHDAFHSSFPQLDFHSLRLSRLVFMHCSPLSLRRRHYFSFEFHSLFVQSQSQSINQSVNQSSSPLS